ncbi:MAG: WecB/TagA/CpsF family glycosyltransferase, partial [Lachnospiraceae bacterium]|nr:WecB/TagA/CpsF family glycosyltransferase [Lachnospiraceae bacterium]
MKKPFTNRILGVNVAVTNMEDMVNLITKHVDELKGEFVCLSNVHTTVMAYENEEYRNIQNSAFIALPDGSPLAFVQRLRGYKEAEQVSGPDLMPALWNATENTGISHYFYGSSEETIKALRQNLERKYPGIKIAGMEAPPFRPLTEEEDAEAVKRINESGASILWVGLGAPKQEEWMYRHRGKINCLMLGVGAGFDFHAGTVKR